MHNTDPVKSTIFLGQICILSRDEYWMWVPRRGMNARAGRRFEFVYLQRTAWDNSKHRPTENSTEAATQLIDTGCPEYIAVSASILKLVILWNTPYTKSVLNQNRIDSYTPLTGVSQHRLYKNIYNGKIFILVSNPAAKVTVLLSMVYSV